MAARQSFMERGPGAGHRFTSPKGRLVNQYSQSGGAAPPFTSPKGRLVNQYSANSRGRAAIHQSEGQTGESKFAIWRGRAAIHQSEGQTGESLDRPPPLVNRVLVNPHPPPLVNRVLVNLIVNIGWQVAPDHPPRHGHKPPAPELSETRCSAEARPEKYPT